MSRIGKKPITIPNDVTVNVAEGSVSIAGPKGDLEYKIRPEVEVKVEDGHVVCSVKKEDKKTKSYWGLTRALIANMIQGVVEGFEKRLELVGVGYRVQSQGDGISMTLGFSHPVEFKPPTGVELIVEDNKNIVVKGIDKNLVGLTAARIRKIRKPEPYKGKGIKYAGEVVRRKPGKSAKV